MRLSSLSRWCQGAAIAALFATTSAHAGDLPLARGLERLRAADVGAPDARSRLDALESIHAEHIASRAARPTQLSDADLASAFQASDMLAFYAQLASQDRLEHHVADMSRLLDALETRGVMTARNVGTLFDALVSARDFASASRLIERFPGKLGSREVPRITFAENFSADRPAVMQLRNDGSLLARNVDREGDHLVVVVGCQQSRRALDRINASPGNLGRMAELTTFWLLPADRMTDPAFLREWNARFPEQQAAFVYRNEAWRNVDFSAMPAFQRFDGERLVTAVKGYPREDDAGALDTVLLPMRDAR